MQELDLFTLFTLKLNELKFNYFITGSVASIIYGEPRLTHDIDIVLEIKIKDVDNFITAFSKEEFYIPPVEVIKNEINRTQRGHFNIIHFKSGFKADVYLTGNDEFLDWGLQNKKEISYANSVLYVAPPEYVIIKKMEFYKEGHSDKHLADIKSMLVNSKEIIDNVTVEKYARRFGLTDLWGEVRGRER